MEIIFSKTRRPLEGGGWISALVLKNIQENIELQNMELYGYTDVKFQSQDIFPRGWTNRGKLLYNVRSSLSICDFGMISPAKWSGYHRWGLRGLYYFIFFFVIVVLPLHLAHHSLSHGGHLISHGLKCFSIAEVKQSGHYFKDDFFKPIFLNENFLFTQISWRLFLWV